MPIPQLLNFKSAHKGEPAPDLGLHVIDAGIERWEKRISIDAHDVAALQLPEGAVTASPVYTDATGIEAAKTALAAGKPVWFVEGFASTTVRDREREIILADAFQKSLPRFMATNPMFLFAHDRREPLGSVIATVIVKGVRVTVGDETYVVDGVWYKATCYDEKRGAQIENKILRTSSIGFPPFTMDDVDFYELPDGRIQVVVRNIDVVEFSLEPTPCNFLSTVQHVKGLHQKSIAIKPAAAVPPSEGPAMKYSEQFKVDMGFVGLSDAEIDAKLADMRTKSTTVDTLRAKGVKLDKVDDVVALVEKAGTAETLSQQLWRKDFEGKLADDVLDELQDLPEAKRKSIADRLVAEAEAGEGVTQPTIGGATGQKGTRNAAAPPAPHTAVEREEVAAMRKGLAFFDSAEEVDRYALMSPAAAIKSVLGLTRLSETPKDRRAVEQRKTLFGIVTK